MTTWYQSARSEFSAIAGTDLKFIETKFRMEPAAAKIASPWAGDTATSAFWRSLANRARHTASLMARPNLDYWQRRAVCSHMKAANRAILLVPKKQREPLREPLTSWTRAFAEAILDFLSC